MSHRWRHPLLWRLALGALLFGASHLFPWLAPRLAYTDSLISAGGWLGIEMRRLGPTEFAIRGQPFEFSAGCMLVDYFLAAVPLLWLQQGTLRGFLARVSLFFVAITAFNLFRQLVIFFAFARGVPWWAAHEVPSGVIDFLILYLPYRLYWSEAGRARRIVTAV